ncbi:MAG TPA: GNAT family N-acetyltransferase [Fimbriimonadaceae bacterium]|nr:GNAT family N-acetyltransferase [Armatimonadota bacterium]HCM73843.1 GNAT family N-acetyltransferase [Armatimonadota bacterium]HRD32429.1 GNAT family N-acetyltransferase [Fimbriimonadaceae bacterium]HRE94847.1 GNAT family N-acetyltransferase [Fimbriimonadaceae bacterium]HRI74161.1 GNAT family N-acetyltransferase [Fimbriimonadaceae bacterium]
MSRFAGPVLLAKSHDFLEFDCGNAPLNTFLVRHALANQANDSARTFVGLNGNRVVGYYSLAVSSVAVEDAPARMSKGLARHPIPILLMARFAVDLSYQGQGIGQGLFKDALKRCLSVSRDAGVRAVMTHAKDDAAKAFYVKFGMLECPTNPLHLYMLLKDVEASL